MRLTVMFFGMLRDATGVAKLDLETGEHATVASVWTRVAVQFPALAPHKPHVRAARNREFTGNDASLKDGDEVAFLPPVSGGSASQFRTALTRGVIDVSSLMEEVRRHSDGAVVTFEGVTRDHTAGRSTLFLDYECYEAMALRVLNDLAAEVVQRNAVDRVVVVHRLGRVNVGEVSVAIAVSAVHRGAAFSACRELIDRLKKTVPIWKKEHFADGAVWVEGEWDEAVRR